MYAVIETGGKQYKVSKGDRIYVEKLGLDEDDKVIFDKVLAFSSDGDIVAGKPYVKDVQVTGKVIKNGKGKKIIVFKLKAKKGYRRTQGHRQPYTLVEITDLKSDDKFKEAVSKVEDK